jgi:hypothetical protein
MDRSLLMQLGGAQNLLLGKGCTPSPDSPHCFWNSIAFAWDNWESHVCAVKFRGLGPSLPDIWKLKNVLAGAWESAQKEGSWWI